METVSVLKWCKTVRKKTSNICEELHRFLIN